MRPPLQALALVALSVLAAALTWWAKGPPTQAAGCDPSLLLPDEICLESLAGRADILWVDARTRARWQRDGLPGSLLWNLDTGEDMNAFEREVAMAIATHPSGSPLVVVYCDDEQCGTSRQVAQRIRDLGLGPGVRVLHGGWQALSRAGRITPSGG